MRKKYYSVITAIALNCISGLGYADILGVEDAQMFAMALKQLSELQAQYRVLTDTYQTAQNQLDNLNQLKSMNSGHYGFGDLNNSLDSLQSWQSPVSTWQDALQNLSGGNPERYQSLVEAYEKNHPSLNETNYARYTTPENVARFKEDKAVNRAVQVQTTQSYRWSRYLVIDFSHPWLKSTRQRAKCLTPTVLRPARCAERASVCLPQ